MQLKNKKTNNEYALSARFYLENSDSGRQIIELYEQIEKKVFVHLNLEKFKELLIDNWICDQDEFIRRLKEFFYNSNSLTKEVVEYAKDYIDNFIKNVNSLESERSEAELCYKSFDRRIIALKNLFIKKCSFLL